MSYLSDFLGKPVKNKIGEPIGKIFDFSISIGEALPVLKKVVIASKGLASSKKTADWDKVIKLDNNGLRLNSFLDELVDFAPKENEILLRGDLLDKQIVDVAGYRVVRVNDLQLNPVNDTYRLMGVDVGAHGLLRRLGVSKLLKKESKKSIISWEYVAPLDVNNFNYIKLTVPHQKLTKLHPADLADILEDLQGKERNQLFSSLDAETAASTLQEMAEDHQVALFNSLTDDQASEILKEMDPDEAADLLADLPAGRAEDLLDLMKTEDASEVKELLSYDEKSAGGIMTTEYISLNQEITAQQTIDLLRKLAPEAETIYYLYVTDSANKLVGVLSLRELIISPPDKLVKDIMFTNVYKVRINSSLQEVAEIINKYDLLAVPVTDVDGKLRGIVTIDDVMDLVLPSSWRRHETFKSHPSAQGEPNVESQM